MLFITNILAYLSHFNHIRMCTTQVQTFTSANKLPFNFSSLWFSLSIRLHSSIAIFSCSRRLNFSELQLSDDVTFRGSAKKPSVNSISRDRRLSISERRSHPNPFGKSYRETEEAWFVVPRGSTPVPIENFFIRKKLKLDWGFFGKIY